MAAPAQNRREPPHHIHAIQAIRSAVDECVPAARQPLGRRIAFIALVTGALALIVPSPIVVSDVSQPLSGFEPFPERGRARPSEALANVWIVESSESHDLYSNGLRVENAFAVQNERRFYQVLDRSQNMRTGNEWRSDPIGIVFHATESPQVPFDRDQNSNLQRVGKALLKHIQQGRSYNFVIDRFGRVFRVVEENDAANHAGNSVWADGRALYLNLNSSFLAIAFEAAADPDTKLSLINNAQVHAARGLTQMLRAKYKISPQNCVTHAQVSVNPGNSRIGYHTDWAAGFPFAELGLPPNYDIPPASITDFGFDYDDAFRQALADKPWRGLAMAQRQLERDAAASGVDGDQHRSQLRQRYKRLYAALKLTGATGEELLAAAESGRARD
jgi:hypothetical protein